MAESFLYVYLGISAISIEAEYVIPKFIVVVMLATIIARFVSVFIPMYVIYLFNGKKLRMGWNQVFLISLGGVIRGAIAFALSL
jgi:NhaP-type Na+/H+ or K+/H+ antiporter